MTLNLKDLISAVEKAAYDVLIYQGNFRDLSGVASSKKKRNIDADVLIEELKKLEK